MNFSQIRVWNPYYGCACALCKHTFYTLACKHWIRYTLRKCRIFSLGLSLPHSSNYYGERFSSNKQTHDMTFNWWNTADILCRFTQNTLHCIRITCCSRLNVNFFPSLHSFSPESNDIVRNYTHKLTYSKPAITLNWRKKNW